MIDVFQQAVAEAQAKIASNRASKSPRRQESAEQIQADLDNCIERLATMAPEVQAMVAFSLQRNNGGLLFLSPTDTAWDIAKLYHAGNRFHAEPMPYKSIF